MSNIVKLGEWYINLDEVAYIHRVGVGCTVRFKDRTEAKINVVVHNEEWAAITKKTKED